MRKFKNLVAATVVFWTITCASVVASSQVSDLVTQVSQANLQGHITALQGERATTLQQAAAADYIRDELEAYGYTVQSDPVGSSENLIADLTGTLRPNEIFLVGAHFDTVSGTPGADDNASGLAGLLEIARVLAGTETDATVRLVAFALEEAGLVGSNQLAQAAGSAGWNLIGMISLEMIGYTCASPCQVPFTNTPPCVTFKTEGVTAGDFVGVVANSASASLITDFETAVSGHVAGLPVVWAQVAGTGACFPDSRRSDHAPFWDEGFPAIMVTDTANFRNPNYHGAGDTLATLDLGFASDVTRATLAMVALRVGAVPPEVPALGSGALLLLAPALGIAGGLALRRQWERERSEKGRRPAADGY
ncbi:MAG: M28 family peptidase [Deltaproteobacteria bacterium]|nr:M28 family peptidase [Deltaproteobacteria bacterium]MBW2359396.1 M28 family peptidase [Deltaproteobacteria bacterium]